MCDKETHEPIKEFQSIAEASREFNSQAGSNIIKVIKGDRKSAFGYWWKYKNNT